VVRSVALTTIIIAAAGCGSGHVDTATQAARLAATPKPAAVVETSAPATQRVPAKHRRRVTLTACDANIRVKAATTSCAFAENVFYAYWRAAQGGAGASIEAYSPVTKRTYAVTCLERTLISCRAGDDGYVRFPLAAIEAYDADQAARYACSHDLGPSETDACSQAQGGAIDSASSGDDGDCDPNYVGACLDPSSSDYDCEGGSGDGPDYTGRVEVVGDDPYGLDSDGDGIGCENSDGSYGDASSDPATAAPTTEDFGSGSGSVGQCADGTLSDSIGRPGACSHHGGVG
jgi:hypothetical protein